jgi:hypothetical protein
MGVEPCHGGGEVHLVGGGDQVPRRRDLIEGDRRGPPRRQATIPVPAAAGAVILGHPHHAVAHQADQGFGPMRQTPVQIVPGNVDRSGPRPERAHMQVFEPLTAALRREGPGLLGGGGDAAPCL